MQKISPHQRTPWLDTGPVRTFLAGLADRNGRQVDPGHSRTNRRVTGTFPQMKKFDLAALEAACAGKD